MRRVTRILDDIIEEYERETPKAKRDWRTYEQRLTQRMRAAIRELVPPVKPYFSRLKTFVLFVQNLLEIFSKPHRYFLATFFPKGIL